MNKEIRAKYRTVFLQGTVGRDVLADILIDLCKFGTTLNPENPAQVAEHNVGVAILSKCGIFSEETKDDVIRALAGVVPLD